MTRLASTEPGIGSVARTGIEGIGTLVNNRVRTPDRDAALRHIPAIDKEMTR